VSYRELFVALCLLSAAGASTEVADLSAEVEALDDLQPFVLGEAVRPANGSASLADRVADLEHHFASLNKVQWETLLQKHGDAVVQIFVVKGRVDWLAPQVPPEEFEVSGTGWLIDNSKWIDGSPEDEIIIVTNAHVAKSATSIHILHNVLNKEPIDVTVVGVCDQRDIALLRVTDPQRLRSLVQEHTGENDIKKLDLGTSDSMKPGDKVVALGFPLGFNGLKITMGVFSGYQVFEHALYAQMDAAINPGNSGGPLLNSDGLVLGINSAKMEGSDGMSFAIPTAVLKAALNKLYSRREFVLPYLGLKYNMVSSDIGAYLGTEEALPEGVMVKQVSPGGIFAQAGVEVNDYLVSVDNYTIDRFAQFDVPEMASSVNLFGLLARKPTGEKLHLKVWRNHGFSALEAVYDETPKKKIHLVQEDVLEKPQYAIFAGIVFSPLTMNLAISLLQSDSNFDKIYEYVGDEDNRDQDVVVVTAIIPGSSASLSNSAVRVGQVVQEVNGKPVKTMADLCAQMQASDDRYPERAGKYWTLKGNEGNFAVFALDKVKAESNATMWKDTNPAHC